MPRLTDGSHDERTRITTTDATNGEQMKLPKCALSRRATSGRPDDGHEMKRRDAWTHPATSAVSAEVSSTECRDGRTHPRRGDDQKPDGMDAPRPEGPVEPETRLPRQTRHSPSATTTSRQPQRRWRQPPGATDVDGPGFDGPRTGRPESPAADPEDMGSNSATAKKMLACASQANVVVQI